MANRRSFQELLRGGRAVRTEAREAVAPPEPAEPTLAPGDDLDEWGAAAPPARLVPMSFRLQLTPEAQFVQETCARVLQERIDLLGIERSGAYEHYQMQLQLGLPIPSYELAIVDVVRERLPNLCSYHEIGSGLGMLPFMLALEGFAAVGIERDQRRHLTATAILRDLGGQVPQIEAQCRLIGAAFPEAVADIDVSESMAIVTDLVCTHEREEFLRVCRGIARYRYVLLDMQRFCSKRETAEQYEDLLAELARFGLVPHPEIIDMGAEGCYYLFESTSPSKQRNEAELAAPSVKTALQQDRPVEAVVEARREAQVAVAKPAGTAVDRPAAPLLPPSPQRARHRRFGGGVGLSALLMIGIPAVLGAYYYYGIAADQYVTKFEFAVRSPVGSKTGGTISSAYSGASMMSPDAFVVTDFINGQQAVEDVGKKVDLRGMFSQPHGDFWSRLGDDVTLEGLTAYWQQMVNAHFDLISGNVSVSVRAFTPEDSLKLSQALIATSDDTFRQLNSQAQRDFVRVADENVARAEQRLTQSRRELQGFRVQNGILDAGKVAASSTALTDNLRKELSARLTQYETLKASSPHSPALPSLKAQIATLRAQIKGGGDGQGGQSDKPINEVTPEQLGRYETLDLNRQFAEKQYTEALAMREKAYMAAQDQQSYLALFVKPALAQVSTYPDRARGFATVLLAAAAAWFVSVLVTYAIRDHLI